MRIIFHISQFIKLNAPSAAVYCSISMLRRPVKSNATPYTRAFESFGQGRGDDTYNILRLALLCPHGRTLQRREQGGPTDGTMMSNNMRLVPHVMKNHRSTHAGSQTVDQRARRLPNIPRAHPPPHVTSAGCSDVSSTGYTRYRRDSYRLASASAAEGGKYITEVPCMISIQHAVLPSYSILLSQYCSPENNLRTICRKRTNIITTTRDK